MLFTHWQANKQITTTEGDPLCAQGPCLVQFGQALFMLYGGKGDHLWVTTTGAPITTDWVTNGQIKTGNGNPGTSYRPAAAVLPPTTAHPNGVLHVVYEGANSNTLWWSWFDGNQWSGNLALGFSGTLPTLAVFGGNLHLCWSAETTAPAPTAISHSVYDPALPLAVQSWTYPVGAAENADHPSLVVYNEALYLMAAGSAAAATPPPPPQGFVIGKFDGMRFLGWRAVLITSAQAQSATGPNAVVVGATATSPGELLFAYRGTGGADLWYAWMDSAEQFFGNYQIKLPSSTPQTDRDFGVAEFGGSLCVAYAGDGSSKIYLSFASS